MNSVLLPLIILASSVSADSDRQGMEARVQAVASARIIGGEAVHLDHQMFRLADLPEVKRGASYRLPLARSHDHNPTEGQPNLALIEVY